MNTEQLKKWLSHPDRRALISINVLEQQADLPKSTLAHWLRGKRKLPEHHLPAILAALDKLNLPADRQV